MLGRTWHQGPSPAPWPSTKLQNPSTEGHMTRVAIVNQHTNNYGDDAAGVALVRAVIQSLGARSIDIFYVWHKSGSGLPVDEDRCQHHFLSDLSGEQDMRPRLALSAASRLLLRRPARPDIRRLVETCREADVVFVAPAGSNIGIYKDWTYLFVLLALVAEGIRPVFCQNTVGESNSWIFNRTALHVLRRSQLFVREAASERWLASQGLSSYLGVDTALLLARPEVTAPDSQRYLAVVPTRLATWHRNFKEFNDSRFLTQTLPAAVAAVANAHGLEVVLVPHLYGPEDDSVLLDDLQEVFLERGCPARVQDVSSFEDYRRALASAEAVVSMRYHGLVLAAHGGVPCVSLAYENKMREAAAYLGLSDLAVDVDNVTEQLLKDHLQLALVDAAAFRVRIRARLDELRAVAHGPLLAASSRLLRS